jgi:uncharacterized FlgJ-related protein
VLGSQPLLIFIFTPGVYFEYYKEYAVFEHNKEKRYTNFDEIRIEIETETERDRLATGKDVSSDPINLKWYSPHGEEYLNKCSSMINKFNKRY